LENADLSGSNLAFSQVLDAGFVGATLTGACIESWQIGDTTDLDNVRCEYIFRRWNIGTDEFEQRLPVDPNSVFVLNEFTQRFKILASVLETIDITFTEGIDWQAFFQSFQDLRAGRPSEAISIQGMERKGDAFVVRLEVRADADKAAIETEVKQRYAHQLAALEAQYQERLRLQSDEIATYRQTQSSLLHIVQTMAEKDSISQTFHGPVGNVAGTNQGQMTVYINQNNEAISQLIAALRASAQTFPAEQKDDVLMELDDLEGDLSKPEKQEPKRIGKRLQRLIAAGATVATLAGGAATFTGNVNDFTANVLDLGEKIGLSKDAIQSNP
jgi:ribosomal protein L21E